jgi:hypothetical protein
MGMFDTIHLHPPLICPVCGAEKSSQQTHAFEDVMEDFRIGSVVVSGVYKGIVKESFWCDDCFKNGNRTDLPLYLVIWHSVLVGVEFDAARAEAVLAAVDRLDLIGWLKDAQQKEKLWKRRYYRLLGDIEKWHEHLEKKKNPDPVPENETPEQAERRLIFARWWGLPEEILNAPDPLGALIEANKPEPAEDTDRDS